MRVCGRKKKFNKTKFQNFQKKEVGYILHVGNNTLTFIKYEKLTGHFLVAVIKCAQSVAPVGVATGPI